MKPKEGRTDDELVIGCHYPGHYEAGERVVITVSDG